MTMLYSILLSNKDNTKANFELIIKLDIDFIVKHQLNLAILKYKQFLDSLTVCLGQESFELKNGNSKQRPPEIYLK